MFERLSIPIRFLAATIALTSSAGADVRLPRIFSDDMLLQRGLAVPVWGWADAGEHIDVHFAGQELRTRADETGRWSVKLDPLEASSEGRSLQINGRRVRDGEAVDTNQIILLNVLVGDVWVCSGQSNMEWNVKGAMNGSEEIAAADQPLMRLFDVPGHTTAPVAQEDVPGGAWRACSPASVQGFSAVGYYFGREIQRESGVPVGLIGTNWGGTRIEPWIPAVGFRSVPELKGTADRVDATDPEVAAGESTWKVHLEAVEVWAAGARKALSDGTPIASAPRSPGPSGAGDPTAIYNAMVSGLVPYGIRGAIWYQGESNGSEGVEYFHKMQALIGGWRQVWDQGDFPIYFYFVQLADFQQPKDDPAGGDGWARIREAQRQALTIPHTGMAVITDIGQANDIHPRNKQDVGARLARWALRDAAGQDLVVSGPLYRGMTVEGGRIRVEFEHVGGGLMVGEKEGLEPTRVVEGGELKRFAVAGEDRVWHWASAEIDGDTLLVSSPEVPAPVALRYAYSMNPKGSNLYNREGLPASAFRTDDW